MEKKNVGTREKARREKRGKIMIQIGVLGLPGFFF
jgi:hypothetical protein